MSLVLWYLRHTEKAEFYCVMSCFKQNYAISAVGLMSGFLTETLTRTRLGGKILFQVLSLCGCMSVMPGRK